MKVALIGSCGYVGSMVYQYFSKNTNIVLTCYDSAPIDVYPPHIKTRASNIEYKDIQTFDVVIYLAGLSRKEDCESISYDIAYDMNVSEPYELAKQLSSNQLFIYSSTASLYTSYEDHISDEKSLLNKACWGNYEKTMFERENVLSSLVNTTTLGLRFGTVIGNSKHMRNELLHIGMFYSGLTSGSIKLWNSTARRSILWIRDLINVFDILINNKPQITMNSFFNISSFNTTVQDTANSVSNALGCKVIKMNDNVKSLGFYSSSEKFSSLFNYKFIGTNDLIIEDFIKNKDKLVESIQNPVGKYVKCIICNSLLLQSVVNLGSQPLANNFEIHPEFIQKYPLALNRCQRCYHTQIDYFVDRELLFKNYIYESGTSATLRKYFSDFAEIYSSKMNNIRNRNVLEIACNDGYQLDEFKKRNWNTYGVDAAENIIKKATDKGHNVQCGFWGKGVFKFTERFDLIVAENVLAHVNNPIDFLTACVSHMDDDTLLVIQTSQANMFVNREFDTIYHEHISFFTIKSMIKAVEKVGCHIEHVYKPSIHGTSYVFEIRKGIKNIVLPLLIEEEATGLYTDKFYTEYANSVKNVKSNTINILKDYKDNGYKIIAYGAAAKGTTFLNYVFDSGPGSEYIPECVIDDSLVKQEMYMPGVNIIVKSIDHIKSYSGQKIVVIVTAWNFFDEIYTRISNYIRSNSINIEITCVRFYPDIKEITN
jgi:nucleoside-diphosphate-sugar epimerase/2-polyprenyl-3-methyl-5-hydroxy-6-metoxy-1,4-benzoquinol methylase